MSEPAPPPSALERWEEIRALFAGRRAAVFLDFDGTLSPIVERPDDAAILPAARSAVERLARRAAALVVVSGRGREDVARRVGLPHLIYAGSHGFDIAVPDDAAAEDGGGEAGKTPARSPGRREDLTAGLPGRHLPPLIDEVSRHLAGELTAVPGAEVEPKTFTTAVHYRRVPPQRVAEVEAVVERTVAAHPELTVAGGKKVFEVRPTLDWHKGKALLHLLAALGLDGEGTVPVYVGDDVTDEDASRALSRRPGPSLTVRVADQPAATAAAYSLAGPGEVAELLRRLADAL